MSSFPIKKTGMWQGDVVQALQEIAKHIGGSATDFNIIIPPVDKWYVNYSTGNDTAYDGKSRERPFKTLSTAYAAATTNNNDVIEIEANGTHIQEDAMITWSKNRIHVVGRGTFGAVDMGPEIQLSATGIAADTAATLKVTGYGNTFTNIYITNAGTHGNSVTALWDAGENNVYTNCAFAKFSDLNVTAVSDVEARGDSTTWNKCKFGVDWVVQSVARPTLWIKGTGGSARMKHNVFNDPLFVCASSESTKNFIEIYDGSSMAFGNLMINPIFMAAVVGSLSAAVLDDCALGHAAATEGNLLMVNPSTNCDSICTVLATGIKVVGPLTHVNAGFPKTPA